MVPVTVDGEQVKLATITYKPAGGNGTFHEYAPPSGLNGHQINVAPTLWTSTMETYLVERGFPARRQ